jgi:peptidoglycan hydrolase CwlO-like protein
METGTKSPPASGTPKPGPAIGSLRWAAGLGALTVVAIVALSVSRADAQDAGTLQSRIDSAEAEAVELAAQVEAGGAELAAAQDEAAAAASRESELTSMLAAGQAREAELQAEVEQAQSRLAEARERLRRALEVLSRRLVAIYKGQSVDETALLLDSSGFDDLTTRATLLRSIQEADQELAARIRDLRRAVAARLEAVEGARDEQAAHNAEVAAARDEIATVRAQAEAEAAALAAARDQQAAALATLRSQVGEWTAQVQEIEAASAAEAQATVSQWVGDYTIPSSIVMCESGGNYGAVNPSSGAGGAYQILPSTWESYGGEGAPQSASPGEQDRIAAMIWADSGGSAWVCAG